MYIDIHTHNSSKEVDVLEIHNIFLEDDAIPESYFSIGLHPWNIDGNIIDVTAKLNLIKDNKTLLAIGEIGFDKNINTSLNDQRILLHEQLIISEQNNLPVILHIVKAFNEIIDIKNKWCYSQPWIIHGFNKNKELAKQLLAKGFYLSLGAKVMRNDIVFSELVKSIDISKLFLETDDQSEFTIKDIYKRVAKIKEISEKELVLQLEHNFKKVFTRYNG